MGFSIFSRPVSFRLVGAATAWAGRWVGGPLLQPLRFGQTPRFGQTLRSGRASLTVQRGMRYTPDKGNALHTRQNAR